MIASTMSPHPALTAQVDGLLRELAREHEALGRWIGAAPGPLIVTTLRSAIRRCETDLSDLKASLAGRSQLDSAYDALRRLRGRATDLFGESLALNSAMDMRRRNLDGGMCAVADRLLRSISLAVGIEWPHFTILHESDYFGTTAQLIRLRYPATRFWDLPVAVHEFGHFFAPRWPAEAGGDQFAAFLRRSDLATREAHYHELFADLFAVFAAGPAYACACLLERFNPREPDTDTHPSHARRAAWILCCLERLALTEAGGPILPELIERLDSYWNAALVASQVQPPDAELIQAMQWNVGKLWAPLIYQYREASCDDMRAAMGVRADFAEAKPASTVAGEYRLRDILNGLWLIRIEQDGREAAPGSFSLDDWGRDLCLGAKS